MAVAIKIVSNATLAIFNIKICVSNGIYQLLY